MDADVRIPFHEPAVCPRCGMAVRLAHLPARFGYRDEWLCPYCLSVHQASKPGFFVSATLGTDAAPPSAQPAERQPQIKRASRS